MKEITITTPDDWHLHVRDGAVLKDVVPHTAKQMARAIIMPNLVPPCSTAKQAKNYYERIKTATPNGLAFEPLMTLYARDTMTAQDILDAKASGIVKAVKLYPAGATTNSDAGVTDVKNLYPALEAMQEVGMPLLVHGEVTDKNIDVFDREAVFIERILKPLTERFPHLKVVCEHITTAEAAQFVQSAGDNIGATITVQHLMMNRNALFEGGLRPHHYCLPVLKRERHREALIEAIASGHRRIFLGTDSAPHTQGKKESCCGCAGIYTAFAAIEFYAEIFETAGAMEHFEHFASFNGPDFYGLARNTGTLTLEKAQWTVPESYPFGDETVIPLRAGEQMQWRVKVIS